MDFGKLRTGELVAGIAGVVLLIVMFFPWYGPEGAGGSLNAWESFSLIDLLLFVTAAAAIGMAALGATGRSVALPVAASVVVTVVGILAAILVLYRLINEPSFDVFGVAVPDRLIDIKIGAYLGFLLCLAIAAGGFMAMADEGTSLGDAARGVQGGGRGPDGPSGGGGTPAPPAPPAPPPPTAPPSSGAPPAGGPPAGTEGAPPSEPPGGPPRQG